MDNKQKKKELKDARWEHRDAYKMAKMHRVILNYHLKRMSIATQKIAKLMKGDD